MKSLFNKIKSNFEGVYNKNAKMEIPEDEIIAIIEDSKLFDYDFYFDKYLKRKTSKKEALQHYLIAGVRLKYNPNQFFDTNYYLTTYPDVKKEKYNPLLHYILFGWKEGRNPSEKFNTNFYLSENADVREALLNPLAHFLNHGLEEGRRPLDSGDKPASTPIDHQPLDAIIPTEFEISVLDILKNSGLFDSEYYTTHYKIVTNDPLKHYFYIGANSGLNPNPYFNTSYYLSENSDVKETGLNPLYHYFLYGYKEGRNPSKEFDNDLYLELYADVKMAELNPLYHFIHHGRKEGRGANRDSIEDPNTYLGWVKHYDLITKEDITLMKQMLTTFKHTPLISIITPVYNPDIKYFRKAVESVIKQAYTNWELCLADDASTDPEVKKVLEEYAQLDKRIKITFRKKNGHISESSNSAIEIATGEFILLLDQDDEIPKHTLFMVAHAINENPEVGIIYSDEDKIDVSGYRHGAYFKSDWNKDLFYGHNMISHLGVYKTSLVKKVGGFRKGYEGSQDYDLAQRVIEQIKPAQIKHIPHVLYHWRTLPTSTALSMDSKNYAYDAALKGLADHLLRTKQNAEVISAPNFGYRAKWKIPDPAPLVSLIIPIKDKVDYLKKCIDSILAKTTYKNYEIIIVDNNSKEKATKKYLNELGKKLKNFQVLKYDGEFNYSAINNAAVKIAKGEIIGLLNNDIEVINDDWLTELVSHAIRKEAGAVGAKLYYSNDTIQHAGIILGIHTVGNHIHKNYERSSAGYFNKTQLNQNFSAVTGACLFVKKSLYDEVGGLDEKNLKVAYNDVDFCLRLREKGYINIWTPFAELYHHESISRGKNSNEEERFQAEIKYMYNKWGNVINNDPYYNPNLSNDSVEFRLAVPPRVKYPWKKD
jgi:GT2 family glycosyltransferase